MGFVRVLTDGLVNADQLIERIDARSIPMDQVRLVRGRVNRLVATDSAADRAGCGLSITTRKSSHHGSESGRL